MLFLHSAAEAKSSDRVLDKADKKPRCPVLFANLQAFEGGYHAASKADELAGKVLKYHAIGNMLFYPYRQLARRGNINVVGKVLSKKKQAEVFLENLESIDSVAQSAGFRIPQSTRLILGDRSFLPNFSGPFSASFPIFNIRDLNLPENTIAMNAISYSGAAARDTGVLLHERTHGILSATYSPDAYVNRDSTIQEFLADSFSALNRDDPAIGMGAIRANAPARNIKTGQITNGHEELDTFLTSPKHLGKSAHDNSVAFSRMLWSLKEKLGREKMLSLLKPIVDDLNFHFHSAAKPQNLSPRDQDIWSFKFVLASMRKTMKEKNQLAGVQELDNIARSHDIADEVSALSEKLKRAGDFSYKKEERQLKQLIYRHAKGAGVAGAEVLLLYQLYGMELD